jgi:hypothetical protein
MLVEDAVNPPLPGKEKHIIAVGRRPVGDGKAGVMALHEGSGKNEDQYGKSKYIR